MNKLLLAVCMATSLLSGIAHAAISLNADRLVYKESEGDASVTVHSNESRGYLVQSWIDSGDSLAKKSSSFVVTPPLFKLAAMSDNVIRVVYLGNGLPADRESLLWLNVKGVPGLNDAESKVESRMVLAINNRIKFFFRPAGLKGEPGDAVKNLHWSRSGNQITVSNESPFNLVLSSITADKESVPVSVVDNNTVIPAFGRKSYNFKHNLTGNSQVVWDAVNDFGTTTKKYNQSLN